MAQIRPQAKIASGGAVRILLIARNSHVLPPNDAAHQWPPPRWAVKSHGTLFAAAICCSGCLGP